MSARGTNPLRSMGSIDSVSSFDSLRAPAAHAAAAEGAAPPNGVPRSPNRFAAAAGNGGVHMQSAMNGGMKELRPPFPGMESLNYKKKSNVV